MNVKTGIRARYKSLYRIQELSDQKYAVLKTMANPFEV